MISLIINLILILQLQINLSYTKQICSSIFKNHKNQLQFSITNTTTNSIRYFQFLNKHLLLNDEYNEYEYINKQSLSVKSLGELCLNYEYDEGWKVISYENRISSANREKYSIDNSKIHYISGVLEGYVYQNDIDDHNYNVNKTIYNSKYLSTELKDFIVKQYEFTIKNDFSSNGLYYSYSLNYTISQFYGMYIGYVSSKIDNKQTPIELFTFYLLFLRSDMEDLLVAFNMTTRKENECTIILKYCSFNHSLIISHNTHNLYSLMNRFYKNYDFQLYFPNSTKKVNGYKFTSRPADLHSKDDYYKIDSNLTIMETSLEVLNYELYSILSPYTVPKWIRNSIANKIAMNGKEWYEIFMINNSYTHNNQWIIIDMNRFNNYSSSDVVYLLEQVPISNGKNYVEDLTSMLFSKSYIASYNTPYFNEVFDILGYKSSNRSRYGYTNRAKIIDKYINSPTFSVDDMKKLIRYIDFTDVDDTISPRSDLSNVNKRLFGGVDAKISLSNDNHNSLIIQGPTNNKDIGVGVFCFDGEFQNYPHKGLSECYDFKWIWK